MRKKYTVSDKDKKDWTDFAKKKEFIYDKDNNSDIKHSNINVTKKLDLHGFSLDKANITVKEFINQSYENGYKQLLIVTGKGLRSQIEMNPYLSKEMSVLKHSIPEFIKNDEELSKKIIRMQKADIKNGGEGAFYIFLKKKKL